MAPDTYVTTIKEANISWRVRQVSETENHKSVVEYVSSIVRIDVRLNVIGVSEM